MPESVISSTSGDFGNSVPDSRILIGVGCQKAGTTSVSKFLAGNGMVVPRQKELDAFSKRGVPERVSRRQYLRKLRFKNDGRLYGEFTPHYLLHPTAVWNLKEIVPEAKIIVSIRNPVNRAFSLYTHAIGSRRLPKDKTFNEFIAEALKGSGDWWTAASLTQGLYVKGISRLYHHYPKANILISNFDHWAKSSNLEFFENELLEFSGLQRRSRHGIRIYNQASYWRSKRSAASKKIDSYSERLLQDFFDESKCALEKLLGKDLGWW